MKNELLRGIDLVESAFVRNWDLGRAWLLLQQRALYGISAARVLVGIACLGILLTNFRMRHVVWGAGSFWAEPYRENSAFTLWLMIFEGDSTAWFTFKYLVVILATIGFTLGWRTRAMTVLLFIGMPALVARAPMMGDAGDNVIRIGLLLMVFMNTAQYWSLDARRRKLPQASGGTGLLHRIRYGLPVLPDWLRSALHNTALLALVFQVFFIYTASALFKAQGSLWQEGTAVGYSLRKPEYGVFPWLSELLSSNLFLVTLVTYFAFYVQLFFVMGLLHPLTRRFFVIGVIALHLGIAVLMGLPWFSLAMVAFDTIFISSRTYQRLDRVGRKMWNSARDRVRGPAEHNKASAP